MFEPNKIIKWGIPGWILMSWIFVYFILTDLEFILYVLTNDTFKSLGLTAILGGIGIPIGKKWYLTPSALKRHRAGGQALFTRLTHFS